MNLFEGVLFGILQGITEWLPISSSGQSMLFLINLFHLSPDEAFRVSAMLHMGSLLAVVFYFREKLIGTLRGDKRLLMFLIAASAASGVIGLPLFLLLRDAFSAASGESATMFIGLMLIITGLVLRRSRSAFRKDYSTKEALIAGGSQGMAILPGISRSGTTIAALLLLGIEQETALSLSFLMAIPAILGLLTIELIKGGLTGLTGPIGVGIIMSFLVSLISMHYLISLAENIDFSGFAIVIGGIAFILPLLAILF